MDFILSKFMNRSSPIPENLEKEKANKIDYMNDIQSVDETLNNLNNHSFDIDDKNINKSLGTVGDSVFYQNDIADKIPCSDQKTNAEFKAMEILSSSSISENKKQIEVNNESHKLNHVSCLFSDIPERNKIGIMRVPDVATNSNHILNFSKIEPIEFLALMEEKNSENEINSLDIVDEILNSSPGVNSEMNPQNNVEIDPINIVNKDFQDSSIKQLSNVQNNIINNLENDDTKIKNISENISNLQQKEIQKIDLSIEDRKELLSIFNNKNLTIEERKELFSIFNNKNLTTEERKELLLIFNNKNLTIEERKELMTIFNNENLTIDVKDLTETEMDDLDQILNSSLGSIETQKQILKDEVIIDKTNNPIHAKNIDQTTSQYECIGAVLSNREIQFPSSNEVNIAYNPLKIEQNNKLKNPNSSHYSNNSISDSSFIPPNAVSCCELVEINNKNLKENSNKTETCENNLSLKNIFTNENTNICNTSIKLIESNENQNTTTDDLKEDNVKQPTVNATATNTNYSNNKSISDSTGTILSQTKNEQKVLKNFEENINPYELRKFDDTLTSYSTPESVSPNETFTETSLPDIINALPDITISGPGNDSQNISSLVHQLNALNVNVSESSDANVTITKSSCSPSIVSSDDEIFAECQSYPVTANNSTTDLNNTVNKDTNHDNILNSAIDIINGNPDEHLKDISNFLLSIKSKNDISNEIVVENLPIFEDKSEVGIVAEENCVIKESLDPPQIKITPVTPDKVNVLEQSENLNSSGENVNSNPEDILNENLIKKSSDFSKSLKRKPIHLQNELNNSAQWTDIVSSVNCKEQEILEHSQIDFLNTSPQDLVVSNAVEVTEKFENNSEFLENINKNETDQNIRKELDNTFIEQNSNDVHVSRQNEILNDQYNMDKTINIANSELINHENVLDVGKTNSDSLVPNSKNVSRQNEIFYDQDNMDKTINIVNEILYDQDNMDKTINIVNSELINHENVLDVDKTTSDLLVPNSKNISRQNEIFYDQDNMDKTINIVNEILYDQDNMDKTINIVNSELINRENVLDVCNTTSDSLIPNSRNSINNSYVLNKTEPEKSSPSYSLNVTMECTESLSKTQETTIKSLKNVTQEESSFVKNEEKLQSNCMANFDSLNKSVIEINSAKINKQNNDQNSKDSNTPANEMFSNSKDGFEKLSELNEKCIANNIEMSTNITNMNSTPNIPEYEENFEPMDIDITIDENNQNKFEELNSTFKKPELPSFGEVPSNFGNVGEETEFKSIGNDNVDLIFQSCDFDYLSKRGNNIVRDIRKDSLLLKFDPLLGKPVSVLNNFQNKSIIQEEEDVITPRKNSAKIKEEENKNDCLINVPRTIENNENKKKRLPPPRLTVKKNSELFKVKTEIDSPLLRLEEFESLERKIQLEERGIVDDKMSVDVIQNNIKIENDIQSNENINSNMNSNEKHDLKMGDLEKKIKNEVLKTEDVEKKLKDAEIREEALLKRITEKDKTIAKMGGVIEAYEKAIAELIAEKEQIMQNYEKQMEEIKSERDLNKQHLESLESTFTDLHAKYERSKQLLAKLKASEEDLQAEKKRNLENLGLQEQRYEKMKNHAMQQLEIANNKLEHLTKNHHLEITKLKALLKKEEIAKSSINEQLIQKSKENEELVKICDELINGGSTS